MLQTLREKTTGWVASVILGLLIVPFAFFGVNNYFSTQAETWVAKVGEKEISQNEFRQRFDAYRNQMRQMMGESFDPLSVETPESKRRILDSLVEEEMMRQAADQLGLSVAPIHLRKEIEQIPAFQTEGKFDVQQYKLLLATQNMSPLSFQERVRIDLQTRALRSAVTESSLVTAADIDNYLKLRDQTRDLRYLVLPAPSLEALAAPSDEAVAKHYESQPDPYKSEETVTIEYLIVDGADIEVPSTPDEESLRERYEEQKPRFTETAQRLASHILLKVPADAPAEVQQTAQAKAADLAAKARAEGADFAALASEFSEDIGSKAGGGDLGWIETGLTDPAFESALFSMEAGAISDPVKSAEGWHVIQLREVRAGATKSFEEVREQLAADYVETERERLISERAGKLVDIVYRDPSTLAAAATELGLEIKKAGPFGRSGGEDPVTQHPAVLQAAFSAAVLNTGNASDALDLGEGRTAIIRVAEHRPSERLALDAVRDQVVSDWQQAEIARLADEAAKAALDSIVAGETLDALATARSLEIKTHPAVTRSDVTIDRQIVTEAFAQARPAEGKPARWIVSLPAQQKALVELTAVNEGQIDKVSVAERDTVRQQMAQALGEAEVRELAAALKQSMQVQLAEDRL